MTTHAWVAIFDRHAWFQSLLEEEVARLLEGFASTSDAQLQKYVAKLAVRTRRHKERITRHTLRGLDLISSTRH